MSSLRNLVSISIAISFSGFALTASTVPPANPANNYGGPPIGPVESDPLIAALPEGRLPELAALLQRGLVDGPRVLMQRWMVAQYDANVLGARAPMLPSVAGNASVGMILEQRQDGAGEDRTLAAVLYSLGVTQPVFHWGALSKGYEVARLQRAIADRNLAAIRRQLALELRLRYFDCVAAAGTLESARTGLVRLEREEEFVKSQVERGFESPGVAGGIAATISRVRVEIFRLETEYDNALRNLRRLAGMSDTAEVRVAPIIPAVPNLREIVLGLPSESSVPPSLAMQTLEDNMRSERLNYSIHRTRLLPKLGVSFSVSQDNKNPDNDALGQKLLLTSWNAFATVNWTIFDGFAAKAAQRGSLGKLRSYEVEQQQLSQQERDERRAETAKLKLVWQQLEFAEQSLGTARAVVASAEKEREAGWLAEGAVAGLRRDLESAQQTANAARAQFYLVLASYLSNRGQDPVLRALNP